MAAGHNRSTLGVLLLIGGGLTLSAQFFTSGLGTWIGKQMGGLGVFPAIILLVAVAVVLILLTELTSNTATAAAFLPVTGEVTVGAAVHPLLMSLTVEMAVTCTFMLPVETPSNAVAYATGQLGMRHMIRGGVWLNIVGAVITIGMLYSFAPMVFGVSP
ncbi:anion permease [Pseudarthrobacter sulfonivorans]|uniref:SLC13 family permease n=1 Tax=Pseudarthrobacter sulfonivorans TaxID=121292 RepID=UPI0028658E9C|nr:anion permease [Pseudarthrobacter sulfonivorans]MDR6417519.1 di/tricarboxylate transporter [Pseudarthrobacter sulfonivorans]